MIISQKPYWDEAKDPSYDAFVCTTNNIIRLNGTLVMGAGIAKAFKEEFKYIDYTWGKIIQTRKEGGTDDHHVVISGPVNYLHNHVYLIGLQTKRLWSDPSPIELVVESCQKLSDLADTLSLHKVLLPKVGCGLGGLKWADVKKEIGFLDERFVVCDA